MDFNKPSNCKRIEQFLMENLKTETEKESLANVITGKSVLKSDAIDLLLTLIQAMTVSNEVNMEEFEAAKINIVGEEDKENKNPKPGVSGTQNLEPKNGTQKVAKVEEAEKDKAKFNRDNVCHFYATNRCKFGKDCRKAHPKICNKFKKFGLKKFNKNNGCTEDCDQYHPMACFESMKTKTCKRHECNFYHINGTKKDEMPKGQMNGQNNTQNNGNIGNTHQNNASNGNTNQSTNQSQPQVFQETRQPWEIAIERVASQMEKMMTLQQSFQNQIQPLLQPQRS